MNLKITGLNFDVTAAIKNHVTEKLERISRHASNVISVAITLSVEKVNHKAEADMYAAVDVLMDKIDRAVLKYKEKSNDVRNTVKPAAE